MIDENKHGTKAAENSVYNAKNLHEKEKVYKFAKSRSKVQKVN